MSSLKKLAIQGTIWTFAGYGASQLLRFASNLILTRLLVPELFGLMAIVNVFMMGLILFSDMGIKPSIIQNKRGDDPEFLNTAWTLQVCRGFGLWVCCLIIAWPVANFYENDKFLWLVPLVGLNTIIAGFNSTSLATLNRKINLGKLTLLDLVKQFLSITVTIVWAYFSPTVWALVSGTLISSFIKMVLSHTLIPEFRNRFCWNKEAFKELFSFGRWIFISTAMTFLAQQSDRLILGKLLSLEELGVYIIAFTLADMPRKVLNKLSGNVIFPAISKNVYLPREELRIKILSKRKILLIQSTLLVVFLVGFGDLLILNLYNEKYAQGAWMMPILAMGLWQQTLYGSMGPALMALGKPIYRAVGSVFTFLFLLIGIPLAFSTWGILGAVVVVALNDLPKYGIMMYGLWREKLTCIVQDIQATLLLFGLLALVFAGRVALGWGLPIHGIL